MTLVLMRRFLYEEVDPNPHQREQDSRNIEFVDHSILAKHLIDQNLQRLNHKTVS